MGSAVEHTSRCLWVPTRPLATPRDGVACKWSSLVCTELCVRQEMRVADHIRGSTITADKHRNYVAEATRGFTAGAAAEEFAPCRGV